MKKPMPYDFLLDYLPASVIIKPAVGMFYIYYEGKIMLIFRKVIKNSEHNGIWISIRHQDQASLKAELPAVTNFVFEEGESIDPSWLQLWDGHDDFEETAIRICELVAQRDPRIGKVTPMSKALK